MVKLVKDITGNTYGILTVLEFSHFKYAASGKRRAMWLCQCDCGNTTVVQGGNMKSGHTGSCGCVHTAVVTKHGMHNTREYKIFGTIKERCNNPNNPEYERYGAKGIAVSGGWEAPMPEGFENFYKDMGQRPSNKHTIERKDPFGDYCPENCIWTDDMGLQSFNQKLQKDNKSGKSGVAWDDKRGKWSARIGFKGKSIFLGRFKSKEDAIKARLDAELKYYGFIKNESN